jgi:hypothetical protein
MDELSTTLSYQFEVVDQGDRVYKRLMSPEESEARFRSNGRSLLFFLNSAKTAGNAIDHAITSISGVQDLLGEYPELGPSLANPVIEENGNYSQDKVMTLGQALRRESTRRARNLIDNYVDLSLRHVSYGFMERVFKITANCGVDDGSNVVLIDLGELTFDKDEAVNLARRRRWLTQETFLWPLPKPRDFALPNRLKPYYCRRMLAQFGPTAIKDTWQQSVS